VTVYNKGTTAAHLEASHSNSHEGRFVLDIAEIQELCRKITEEKDPVKAHLLISELRETIAVDSAETRLRLGFMARFLKKTEKGSSKPDSG
jgi:hypothetical protein